MPQKSELFSKMNFKILRKRVAIFLLINALLCLSACFVVIYWPVPSKKNIENYDYSSINEAIVDAKKIYNNSKRTGG